MKIPEKLRNTPDYMVIKDEAYLLEAKGCHDILRLKTDDMKSYNFWDNLVKLYVFVYSTMERSHKIISYEKSLHDFSKSKHKPLVDEINSKLDYNDDIESKLRVLLDEFKEQGVFYCLVVKR